MEGKRQDRRCSFVPRNLLLYSLQSKAIKKPQMLFISEHGEVHYKLGRFIEKVNVHLEYGIKKQLAQGRKTPEQDQFRERKRKIAVVEKATQRCGTSTMKSQVT